MQLSLISALARYGDKLVQSSGQDTKELTRNIRSLLIQISDLSKNTVNSSPDLYNGVSTEHGTAISPISAISCIDDSVRTKQFVHGIRLGISERIARASSPQHLLYAGTGPFAPLVLANLHKFDPTNLRVHFMDINPISIDYLRRIVDYLGYSDFVEDYCVADASTVSLDYKPDILLTETMSNALLAEPQYWIVKNLKPQLQEGALIIPEEVRVDLVGNFSTSNQRINLGRVIRLAKDSDLQVRKEFKVPKEIDTSTIYQLFLETNIKVFEGVEIRPDESDITDTYQLKLNRCPETIRLQYCPGEYGAAINYAVGFGD